MNITTILASLFCILLLIDFRKFYIILLVIYSLITFRINIQGLNLFTFIGIIAVFLFFIRYKINFKRLKEYPFHKASILIIASMCITTIFAQEKHIPSVIMNILITLFMPYIFWILLNQAPQKVIKIFTKAVLIYSFAICTYTLFELITKSNPFLEILDTWGLKEKVTYITEIRYGLKRCQSFFNMHTTLGGVCMSPLALFLFMRFRTYTPIKKEILNVIIIMLILSILFTGARSAFISCLIVLLLCLNKQSFTPQNVLLFILCIFIITIFEFNYIYDFVNSIINSKAVEGSNSEMRLMQYSIALKYMLQSPIWGNGFNFIGEYIMKYFPDEIYGAESMWLSLMVDHGLIGVLAYIYLFYSINRFCKRTKNKELFFFLLGYYIFNTLSSIPDCYLTFIIIYILVMCKMKDLNAYKKVNTD